MSCEVAEATWLKEIRGRVLPICRNGCHSHEYIFRRRQGICFILFYYEKRFLFIPENATALETTHLPGYYPYLLGSVLKQQARLFPL